jgi:hypothetical protein
VKTLLLALFAVHAASVAAVPSYKVVDFIAVGGEVRWDYLAADSRHHRLYVSHGSVTEVIDTITDKVVGSIPGTAGVHGIAIASNIGFGFTSNGRDNSVTVFELDTLKIRATIRVGSNPDAIVYEPISRRVVTFNGKSHDATVIDAASIDTNGVSVLGTVPVGGKPEFAQPDNRGSIYFNIEDTSELAVIDPVAMKITARHSLVPCESPTGLAIDDQRRLYSVCENKIAVVTGANGIRSTQVGIGSGSDGIAWLDGFAYSANGIDGTMSVIKAHVGGKAETVETITTAYGARTIAADQQTKRLYLPTADFEPLATPGSKRIAKPDSFRVLVMARVVRHRTPLP